MTKKQIVSANIGMCRVAGAMLRLGIRKMGIIDVAAPAVPAWFEACFDSYWRSTFGTVPLDVGSADRVTAGDLGYFQGNAQWFRHWLERTETVCERILARVIVPKVGLSWRDRVAIIKARNDIFPLEVEKELELLGSTDFRKFWSKIERRTEALPYAEKIKYQNAKTQGMLGPSGREDGMLDEGNGAPVRLLLMLLWPVIEELSPPVARIHQNCIVPLLGKNRAGDLKSFQKTCQRIGLKTRNRGRPKQSAWPFPPRRKPKRRKSKFAP